MDDPRVQEPQIQALAVIGELAPWRKQLAGHFGTGHGNASLLLRDVVTVALAGFFNPLVRSLRLLEALSSQEWMQRQTAVGRLPRSTLSDALRRFDATQLDPLVKSLAAQVPALAHQDPDLAAVHRAVLAADGSYFRLPGEVAWALLNRSSTGRCQSKVRWNLQLEVANFIPVAQDLSGGDDGNEAQAFARRLQPGVIYLVDRNFVNFGFLRAVLGQGSNFVLRLKKTTGFEVRETRALTARDREAGVQADEVGVLRGPTSPSHRGRASRTTAPPAQLLRRVSVWDPAQQETVVLLTDLLDVPAYVIAALYRQRWQIELFFRWLKLWANLEHLWSLSPQGITLQFYVAVIGTLLLHLATGRRVSKYALFWLGSVASGLATWEQMHTGLARIEREKALERARRTRKQLAAAGLPPPRVG
jgi:hypothetical protein